MRLVVTRPQADSERTAAALRARGHEVKMGTRDPGQDKVKAWVAKSGEKASAGTFEETAKFGELVVIATLWEATPAILKMAGPEDSSLIPIAIKISKGAVTRIINACGKVAKTSEITIPGAP